MEIEKTICDIAAELRAAYSLQNYDPRPTFHPYEKTLDWKMSEDFRVRYACFKWAVARVLQPKSIFEVGVYAGCSALAFLSASPTAAYIGIDDGSEEAHLGHDFMTHAQEKMREQGYMFQIAKQGSMEINAFPKVDLVHVDANHSFRYCGSDVTLALRSGSEWILVDDAVDSQVAAATLDAAWKHRPGTFEWAYFDDTWTGDILLHNKEPR